MHYISFLEYTIDAHSIHSMPPPLETEAHDTSWQMYIFVALACLVAIAVVGVEFATSGIEAAIVSGIGFSMAGLLWLWTSDIARRDRMSTLETAAHMDEELRKARRTLVQQQAAARTLVERDLELSHANEQLREIDQIKSEFVTVATHQLRTPLSAIRWTLFMLIKGDIGPISEEQRKFLSQAYENNNRLIALLHDIALADRIESGKMENTGERADALAVIDSLLAEVRPLAEQQGVSISFSRPDETVAPLRMGDTHLHTVLQNLVENAVKYSKAGGVVTVALGHDGTQGTISITDTGIGIPREMQNRIFSRFYRAENAVRAVTDGSGLGLYIAKRIVEHAGGTLTFTSMENVGTTFVVTLPMA